MKNETAVVVARQPVSTALTLTHQANATETVQKQIISVYNGKAILAIREKRAKLIADTQAVQKDLAAANTQLNELVTAAGKTLTAAWKPLKMFEAAFKAAKLKVTLTASAPTLILQSNKPLLSFTVTANGGRNTYDHRLNIDVVVPAPADVRKRRSVIAAIDKRMAAIEKEMITLSDYERDLPENRQVIEGAIDERTLLSNPEAAAMFKAVLESNPIKI